jgi:release factor glutamine methyltransferase
VAKAEPPGDLPEPANAGQALRWAVDRLRRAGCDTPRLDTEVLLAHVMGRRREALLAHPEQILTPDEVVRFRDVVARRGSRCPVAYLTGRREFLSLEFEVGPGVLIPRPETELLVEVAVSLAGRGFRLAGRGLRLADVGTGSGAVALALARLLPGAAILATDISAAALACAARNAARLLPEGPPHRVTFHPGDLLEALAVIDPRPVLDGVVANLPYVSEADWAGLPPDVRDYEPVAGLLGGPDGLDLFRRLAAQLPDYLAPHGFVCLEVGLGQASAVRSLLEATGLFAATAAHRDLAGHERVVSAAAGQNTR